MTRDADRSNRLADFRQVFADVVVARADCRDAAIRKAFATVPRHEFIGPGPWLFTEGGTMSHSDDPALLYQDVAMGLAPARGITTGLPSLHARCMDACEIKRGEQVLHVGAGSGYFTAILAELVSETGEVVAFEIDNALAELARENLRPWPWAKLEAQPPDTKLPLVDVVYVCAGVEQLPLNWLTALRPGGRLLLPLVPKGGEGAALLVRNVGSRTTFSARFICSTRFVPCLGALDDELRAHLVRAFSQGSSDSVRSLRLDPERPDSSAWFSGHGWWLSTTAPSLRST